MDLPKHATRGAILLSFGVAALGTWLAEAGKQLDASHGLEYDAYQAAAWAVFVAAAAAWNGRWPWAPWTAGLAAAASAVLSVTTVWSAVAVLVVGHAATALLLVPGLRAETGRRGWTLPARLGIRTHPLRWTTAVVALTAAVAANFSGALYAELEPRTEWGPWTYVALAWLTSALAACAWLRPPWRVPGLVTGGLASAAWFVAMLPYQFVLNLAGHALAAVFLLATAWDEWRTEPTRSTS